MVWQVHLLKVKFDTVGDYIVTATVTAKKDGAVKDVVSDVTVVAPKKTAVIRPEMTQEDIDMILSELSSGDILTVSSGDYSINENVLNHKRIKIIVPGVTVKLLGGNYTRHKLFQR